MSTRGGVASTATEPEATVTLDEVPATLDYIVEHGTGGKRYVVDVGMSGS